MSWTALTRLNPGRLGRAPSWIYLVQRAKGLNAAAGLSGEWAQISQEELLVQNPDIILLGRCGLGCHG
jgi:ABC-type Fe3+-hydroxamate transport system substrate-binding protein